jgi:2-succinyl-6-hydroxy-2,4-cyclohexadiene-1-carboxylate synthase
MGGRLALHLALSRPDLVRRLVLIGATAGIADEAERTARRTADEALAEHLERIGVDAFLDEWLAQPLFAHLSVEAACLDERRRNSAGGLASSLRRAGTGTQRPLWGDLHRLTLPVLLLAGEHDPKFTEIARQMAEHIGRNATVAIIDGAGHSVHLEEPDRTTRCVRAWLDDHPASEG